MMYPSQGSPLTLHGPCGLFRAIRQRRALNTDMGYGLQALRCCCQENVLPGACNATIQSD